MGLLEFLFFFFFFLNSIAPLLYFLALLLEQSSCDYRGWIGIGIFHAS